MSYRLIIGGLLLVALVIIGAWYFAVDQNSIVNPSGDGVVVAATIFPLADIVKNIGGEAVEVLTIVKPGANEHSYALTAQQVAQLGQAKVIFHIGQGLDEHIVQPLQRTHGVATIAVDRGIQLRQYEPSSHEEGEHVEDEAASTSDEHGHDTGPDPHYWLTVPNAITIAQTITTQLSEIDPANRLHYEANLAAYQSELNDLEQELQQKAQGASQRHFIAMHNAWSYLAPHYGFELVATYEPVEGSQPSLQDLQELQAVIERHGIKVFYAEPQKISSSATKLLQNEFDVAIRTLDPTGGTDGKDSYRQLMQANIEALSSP